MSKYDLSTDEGIQAFNSRIPKNPDGTLYEETQDAKLIKSLYIFSKGPSLGEILDEKITSILNSINNTINKIKG